jgi:CHAD domain-containing protein
MSKVARAAADATAAAVLGPVLRQQVAELRSAESGVRLEEPEGVHLYRVAARRLRSELAGFRSLLDPDLCRGLVRELGRSAAVLSGARDADVVRHRVDALLLDGTDELGEADRALLDRLLREASGQSYQGAVRHLETPEYDELTRRLERLADLPPWSASAARPAEEVLRPLLRQEWARFRTRSRAVVTATSGTDDDDRLHEARKAAKRARYVAEAATPVFGRRARRLGKAAQRLQVVLGEHQDCTLTQAVLARAGEQASLAGRHSSALGRLQAREATRAEELRQESVRLFLEADLKKLRRWLG